jgi:integrase
MVTLRRDDNGNFTARKRLPADVANEYGRLYGQRHEAKLFVAAGKGATDAKRLFAEWEAEVAKRVAAIRAEQRGEGIDLSPKDAFGLAGEWYRWFVARHEDEPGRPERWDTEWWLLINALMEYAPDEVRERPMRDLEWTREPEIREGARPILADRGHTAQFLADRGVALTNAARTLFLDSVLDNYSAALLLLERRAKGDYEPDELPNSFPAFAAEGTKSEGSTPLELFETWVAEKQPAWNTEAGWKGVFRAMTGHFQGRSAASITREEAQQWVTGLIGPKRSARTVDNNYISAARTVFGWAVEHKRISRNVFTSVKITIPRRVKLRERFLRPEERRIVLAAALQIGICNTAENAARRWVPWLCAYTGARPGEITQLRGSDVFEEGGVVAIRITPDAGSVKNRETRIVPLHNHLVEQGFLAFVASHGAGPLFYNPNGRTNKRPSRQRKPPRSIMTRQRLAHWIRSLGVSEKGLSPLHAWRHTFKRLAARAGIEAGIRDAICGHSPRTVADQYEMPTLEDMAEALKKFPRYEA